ncbi:MAG: universal stress protein [Acidaminobacteraceae bacterium]
MRNKKRIMVCVTQQKSCERLILHADEIRKHESDEIHVVHVVKENWKYFGMLKESDALDYLFESSKGYGASLSVIKATDIEETLKSYAQKNKIDIIIMGESLEPTALQNMINRLQNKTTKEVEFEIVPVDTDAQDVINQ